MATRVIGRGVPDAHRADDASRPFQEVRREGVPQHVGRHAIRREPGPAGAGPQAHEEVLPRHGAPPAGEEDRIGGTTPLQQPRTRLLEVAVERLERRLAERHQPLPSPLAEHAEQTAPAIDGTEGQGHELAHAEPRPVEDLEHRAVAQRQRVLALHRRQQAFDVRAREHARQAP
jgi:hypothetical protein